MATGTAIICRASAVPDIFEHGCKIDAAERNRFRLPTSRGAQIYGTQTKLTSSSVIALINLIY
ncbi:antiholin [Escherichia coli]|nr:antiholin [Escherichia coli]